MRTIVAALLTAALAVVPLTTQSAGSDKTLSNLKGSVQSRSGTGALLTVPPNAQIAVNDKDTAITGVASQAEVTLPDSSTVLIGQSSQVQLAAFNQADIATANFVIVNGKTRFTVRHPQGLKANYTFQTSTGQIAVRGTEGDVSASDGQLQVNVYDLTDPNLPVHVTLNNGQQFDLGKGQSLITKGAGTAITSSVTTVTETTFQPFTEFGLPQNADEFGLIGQSPIAPGGSASGTTTAILGGAAAAAGLVILGSGNKSPSPTLTIQPPSSPTPTPLPQPTVTAGVPIGITAHAQQQPNAAPPAPSPQMPVPAGPGRRPGPP